MIKEFLRGANKLLNSNPEQVDRIIVSTFVHLNDMKLKNNKLIYNLVIREADDDWDKFQLFKHYFTKYYTVFKFEDLIELFELVVSPADKKVNGAVYTPEFIRNYIVENSIKQSTVKLSNALVCDVACGCGGFLYSYAKAIKILVNKSYSFIYENLVYGVDITSYSVERSKIILSLLAILDGEDEDFVFNIKQGNSLDFDWRKEFASVGIKNGFDFVMGNPPYVCAKNLSSETRSLLSNYPVCLSGNPDLYIPFFQIGLEALNSTGVLGYITVNSFTKSINGRKIREYFFDNSFSFLMIDFGDEQVFRGRSTYTCICIIGRAASDSIQYKLSKSSELDSLKVGQFESIPYSALDNHKGWVLGSVSINKVLNKLRTSGTPLHRMADIKGGFATLKNKIYLFTPAGETDTHFLLKAPEGCSIWIEKGLCRKAINANDFKALGNIDVITEQLIFPYKLVDDRQIFDSEHFYGGKIAIMEENIISSKFPNAYDYLKSKKLELSLRDKGKAAYYDSWYAFGRAQGLNNSGYKLVFPHIADHPCFVYTENSDLLFYNGFSIVSWDSKKLKVLQKVLMSSWFWFYVKHTSKPYAGGYFGLGKNFIKDFSIPVFSKEEEKLILRFSNSKDVDKFLANKYGLPLTAIAE